MSKDFPQPFGPYELLRPLGRGGMAEVFLAQAMASDGDARLVALKRMHAGVSEDEGAVEMLIAEARLAMRFNHPNIAASFELGCHDGSYYILMEYVDGLDLGAVARLAEAVDERLPPQVGAFAALGIARALAHAHELTDDADAPLGVVHRDVSPQNILVSRHGELKLIDFGVAKVASRVQKTMAGVIKGKYAYMSPEQATAEKLDGRSDVFSLGICLHEWITGQPLFRGPDRLSPFAVLLAVREHPVPPADQLAPEVGPELAALVAQCLERDREARFDSATALADALEAWLATHAPEFGPEALVAYVDDLVSRAPSGTLPQRSLATPALSKMLSAEFAPSELSVVARSPLEASTSRPRPIAPALSVGPRPVRHMPVPRPSTRASGSRRAPRRRPSSHGVPTASQRSEGSSAGRQSAARQRPRPPGHEGSNLEALARLAVAAADHDHPGDRLSAGASANSPRSWHPRRRTVMQLLWVGLAALVFSAGWSIVATLKRFELF